LFSTVVCLCFFYFFFQAEDGIRDGHVTGVQTCALPISPTRDEESSSACSIAHDLTPGDYDTPVFSLGGQDDYAFSPDGQEICYRSEERRVGKECRSRWWGKH